MGLHDLSISITKDSTKQSAISEATQPDFTLNIKRLQSPCNYVYRAPCLLLTIPDSQTLLSLKVPYLLSTHHKLYHVPSCVASVPVSQHTIYKKPH